MVTINRCGLVYPDKVTIITGGSKGIGEGCARVFVDAGAKVVICARGVETGEVLAKELNQSGPGTCEFLPCDVSKKEDIKRLIETTVDHYGRIDCLINNAGYHPSFNFIDDFDEEQFLDVLKSNLVSYFNASKYALPHLRKTRGSIINMGSLVAQIGEFRSTLYTSTKGGISSLTKALAIEEARNGVRVNVVLPGNILSDSRRRGIAALPEEIREEIDQIVDRAQVTGRSGTNEEVGQLCLFLATDAASYITGTEIIISGGSEIGYGVKYPLKWV
ncbi:MAG: SDR family oxidoreductase [Armatimonadetes bacterium]|nr:SDR family oxidoreductase [Armatimonadota bacterium]